MPCIEFKVHEVTWLEEKDRLSSIRTQVFIVEQNVPEDMEWDGLDSEAVHLLAISTDGLMLGTVRLLMDGHIGRMAVIKECRNQGVGRAMLARIMEIAANKGLYNLILNAQTTAIGFYEKAGFHKTGAEFLDAGIPHFRMVYRR